MNDQEYILWLPSWYPNKIEPLSGDFIQRHARAASLHQNIRVVYVVRDVKGVVTNNVHIETTVKGRLAETIVYYHLSTHKFKTIDRILSSRLFFSLYHRIISRCINKEGKPAVIHLYIAFRAGLVAYWMKKLLGIPYVISEQWTLYLPEAKPTFSELPIIVRWIFKKIFKEAKSVMAVSDYLLQNIKQLFSVSDTVVIPNVVDREIFSYSPLINFSTSRFVHVSTLNYQKNPEAILEAFSLVKQNGYLFHLDIVGPLCPNLQILADKYGLSNLVSFHNEMPQQKLVGFMQRADALVLFSRYETFGCVIIEANACGVPVILSDLMVMHENVESGVNGIFATNEDPASLASQIVWLIRHKHCFDREKIAQQTAEKYNYLRVGESFKNWYDRICQAEKRSLLS